MSVTRNSISRLLQPKKTKGEKAPSDSPAKAPNNLRKTLKKESGSYTNKGGIAGDDVFKSLGAKKSQVKSQLPTESFSNKMTPGPDGVVKNARLILSRGPEGKPVRSMPPRLRKRKG